MYDIIGDTHGHAKALKALLQKLSYQERDGVWQHKHRKVLFLGDYIDRGPEIPETLHIVKSMTDAGHAIALMGNHEYNALAYAHQLLSGQYLREHNEKHYRQHQHTLQQFEDSPAKWKIYLDWFRTLPLFYEGNGFRAVHACWDEENISWLRQNGHDKMSETLLVGSHIKSSKAHEVIDETLKGKEITIPEEYAWHDKDGNLRTQNRLKWWVNPEKSRYHELVFNCPAEMLHIIPGTDLKLTVYPEDALPVFFGHYWLSDLEPVLQSQNVACLDYSIAKQGLLVAYRFNGESELDKRKLVYVAD